MSTLKHLRTTGHDHSWFILTQKIIEKEFALSGSEQNPDLTGKDLKLLASRLKPGAPGPVEAFKKQGEDFLIADTVEELVRKMNELAGGSLDPVTVRQLMESRDRQLDNTFGKDAQIAAIRAARRSRGDRIIRVAPAHRLLDPDNGPLIAVRLTCCRGRLLGACKQTSRPRCWTVTEIRYRDFMRRGKLLASAEGECTATTPSRAPSLVDAFSREKSQANLSNGNECQKT